MIGFIIGVFGGVIFGVVIMALLSFHKLTEYEEEILELRRRVAELEENNGWICTDCHNDEYHDQEIDDF